MSGIPLVGFALCRDCEWETPETQTDPGEVDRAAERHTKTERHTTTTYVHKQGRPHIDRSVHHHSPGFVHLRAGEAVTALEEHEPCEDAGGYIVCASCDAVTPTLDYRQHVVDLLVTATRDRKSTRAHTPAERRLDTERDTR